MSQTEVTIRTNNVRRLLEDRVIDGIEDTGFYYKGSWYSLDDFMTTYRIEAFKGWSGYSSDSFFSGVLVKMFVSDPDHVIVGQYFS